MFKLDGIQVHAKTLIDQKDSGEWTNLEELIAYNQKAHDSLRAAILAQDDKAWEEFITTKEFGTKTKAEALGRIISHTAYHGGQLAIILKYGH